MLNLTLKPGHISLNELRQVSRSPVNLTLDPEAIPAIEESTQVVDRVIAEDRTVYVIISNSSSVNLPGFNNTLSGTPTLPTSCKGADL